MFSLKKLILITLIAFGAWNYYEKTRVAQSPGIVAHKKSIYTDTFSPSKNVSQNFSCDGRQHCSQMRSYEEAKYFIRNCPNTKMDGDRDGIPCERQFGR